MANTTVHRTRHTISCNLLQRRLWAAYYPTDRDETFRESLRRRLLTQAVAQGEGDNAIDLNASIDAV